MSDITAIAPLLKSLKGRLAAHYGARLLRVLVFGSYARSETRNLRRAAIFHGQNQ